MANTIGTAYIQIEPTTEGIQGKLSKALDGDATAAGKSAGSKLSGALGGALKVGGAAVLAVGTAVASTGVALVSGAKATAEYGDNIDKMSQKLGVSSKFYQEWDAVLQHSGTTMEAMKPTFKTLSNAVQDGSKDQQAAFKALGLSMDELKGLSTEEVFERVIAKLQDMEEGTERTAIASDLLGKGATELGALLNTSAEDTQRMIDTVHELGGVMSNEAVKDAAAFQDSLQNMQTAFAGVKNSAMSELLPGLTSIMDGFSRIITGVDGAEEKLKSGFEQIGKAITNALPTLVKSFSTIAESVMAIAPEILGNLVKGIVSNLDTLIPAAIDMVMEIIDVILDNLQPLIEAALQIILALAMGIAEHLPELIPAIVETVLAIVEYLLDNIDLIIDAAIAIMMGLIDGIINALPLLIKKIPEIIVKIIEAIIRNIPKIIVAIVEAIPDILVAIVQAFAELGGMLGDLFSGIWDSVKVIFSGVGDWFGGVFEKAKGAISNAWDGVSGYFSEQWEITKNGYSKAAEWFGGVFEKAKGAISNAWDSVSGYFSNQWEVTKKGYSKAGSWFKDTFSKAKEGVTSVWGNLTDFFKKIWDNIKNVFANVWERFSTIGGDIVRGIKEGISKAWDSLTSWFSSKAEALTAPIKSVLGIHSPSRVFSDEVGRWIPAGIASGIENGLGTIDDAMSDVNGMLSDSVVSAEAVVDSSASAYRMEFGGSASNNDILSMLAEYLPAMARGNNVNVTLEGDADGLFRAVRRQNDIYKGMTGRTAFA